MQRLFILLFMLTFYSGISYATTFSSEDLVGNWRGFFMETTELNTTRVARNIRVEIAPENYAVSGTWLDKGYANVTAYSGNINGGAVNITAKGEITGTINIMTTMGGITDTITIMNGWMDIDKNIFYIVTARPGGQLSMGMLVRYQHAFNSFPTSDLEGIWFVNSIQTTGDSTEEDLGDWVVDILSTAATGSCTGNWYSSGNTSGTIINTDPPNSFLSLEPSYGWITGALNTDTGSQIDIYQGQMNSDKNAGALLANLDIQAPGGGKLTSGIFMRAGGTGFVSQDLKGTWAVYITEVYSGDNMYWLYGEVTIDHSGALIKGDWRGASGATGTFTSGQVNIADSGRLTGTITSSAGPIMYNIKKGLLSLSKNHASITLEFGTKGESGHRQDTGFMIRKSNNFTIAPFINLLLD